MAAATAPFVSVEDYLKTSYEPDADYVDGEIEERNVGDWEHALLQKIILLQLARGEEEGRYTVIQELRVQVTPTSFRVPDLCVIRAGDEPERIVMKAPLLCIEVLSPKDTYTQLRARCRDYLRMGVPEVWIFEPSDVTVEILRGETIHKVSSGLLKLEGTSIELDLEELRAGMVRRK